VYLEGIYTRFRNPNNNDFFVGLPLEFAPIPPRPPVFPNTNEVKTVTGGCYDLTSDQSFVPKNRHLSSPPPGRVTWTG